MKKFTIFFALALTALVAVMFSGCYNAGYVSEEKEEAVSPTDLSEDVTEEKTAEEPTAEETPEETKEEPQKEEQASEEKEEPKEEASAQESKESESAESGSDSITVTEGELVQLKVKAYDPDGDKLTYIYGKPLDAEGKWQTRVGDEGKHEIEITVSDGRLMTKKSIIVNVLHMNRGPTMERMPKIIVNEGDTIKLMPRITDPEGDEIKITYSGWMNDAEKNTGYDDAGKYKVTITATDGKSTVSQDVEIEVRDQGRSPIIEDIIEITLGE